MIEVTVKLNDLDELDIFNEFMDTLVGWRSNTGADEEAEPSADESAIIAAERPQPPPITDADLETAITAYWKKMGLPAAKEVLAKYGVERVGAIPANRRGEAMLDMAV